MECLTRFKDVRGSTTTCGRTARGAGLRRLGKCISCNVLTMVAVLCSLSGGNECAAADKSTDTAATQSFFAANGFLNRGQDELASKEYESFLTRYPEHPDATAARYGLGVATYRLRRYKDAVRALTPVYGKKGFEFAVEAGLLLGRAHHLDGNYAGAVEVLNKALTLHGDHKLARDMHVTLIEGQLGIGAAKHAVETARAFRRKWSEDPERGRVEFFGGRGAMAARMFDEATACFEYVVNKHADDVFGRQAKIYLARCYHEQGKLELAADAYRKAIDVASRDIVPDLLLGCGLVHIGRGEFERAVETFTRLLEEYPASRLKGRAAFECGRALRELGKFADAGAHYAKVTDAQPAVMAEAAFWNARCALDSGDDQKALTLYREFLTKYPDSTRHDEATYDLAAVQIRNQGWDEARAGLERLVTAEESGDTVGDAVFVLMTQTHQRAEYKESLRWARHYNNSFPAGEHRADAEFLAGENLYLLGEYKDAATAIKRFLANAADDRRRPRAELRLGMCLLQTDDDGALAVLQQVANGDDSVAVRGARLALADEYFRRGEWKPCVDNLRPFLDHTDDAVDADVMLKAGIALARLGESEKALECLNAFVEHAPQDDRLARAHFERGQLLNAVGRTVDARRAFETAADAAEDKNLKSFAWNELGRITMSAAEPEEAAKYFAKAAEITDDSVLKKQSKFQRAIALYEKGDLMRAYDLLKEYASEGSEEPQAGLYRGLIAAKLDDCVAADEAIGKVDKQTSSELSELAIIASYETAWCFRRGAQPELAEAAYRRIIARKHEHSLWHAAVMELAGLLEQRESFEQATELLVASRARMQDLSEPDRSRFCYRLGINAFRTGDITSAVDALTEVKAAAPDSAMAASTRFFLADARLSLNKVKAAAETLRELIEQAGEEVEDSMIDAALLRLGEAESTRQRWRESEQAFMTHRTRFPDSDRWFQAQFGMAWAQEQQNRFEDAIASYRRLVESHKGNTAARAQFQIGECRFAQQQYDEALRELLKVDILFAYPEWSAGALFEAGRCFEQLNRTADAKEQFQLLIDKYPDTEWAQLAASRMSSSRARRSLDVPGRGTD